MKLSNRSRRLIAVCLSALMLLAACSSADEEATSATETETSTETTSDSASTASASDADGADTTSGVDGAQWSDTITITISDGSFRFVSDGIPDHELPDQFMVPTTGSFSPPVSADETTAVDTEIAISGGQGVDQEITLTPVLADEPTDTSLGIIGVALSGAMLYNDYEDSTRDAVALNDNFTVDGVSFVDSCNGHPAALASDGSGQGGYHYHGIPYCISDVVDVEGEHGTLLGFVIDGFPFYSNQDEGGVKLTNADLDECSGHFGATPEFPDGIYHYHLTEDESPYTIDCYMGVVEVSENAGGGGGGPEGGEGGGPPLQEDE